MSLSFSNCITTQSPQIISHTRHMPRQEKSRPTSNSLANVPAYYPQPVRTPLKGVRPSRRAHMQCPNKVRETCGYRGGVQHPVEWQSHSYHWGLPPTVTICSRKLRLQFNQVLLLPLCGFFFECKWFTMICWT